MRITNNMLVNNSIADMNKNLERMQKVQEQMTSGSLYQKPSDNPTAVTRSLQLKTSLASITQYNSNISNTSEFVSTTDTTLGQAGDVIQNIRQLLVSAGTAGETASDNLAIKDAMNQDIAQFAQILNTNFGGKYIFGGTSASTKPVDTEVRDPTTTGNTALIYCNSTGVKITDPSDSLKTKMKVEIAQGVTVAYSATATDIIGDGTGTDSYDLRQIFTNIVNHLDGNVVDTSSTVAGTLKSDSTAAATALSGDDLKYIDIAMNKLLSVRSQVGAMSNRLTNALDQNTAQHDSIKNLLSKTEDTDITQATIQFASLQSVYLASLQTSAKIMQPSLMDYLK